MKADLSALDWKYRAKRSGMSPVEYAASIQRFKPKARPWGAVGVTVVLLLAALALKA